MKTCGVCRHPEQEAIDTALIAGESLRSISGRLSVSRSALHRHKQHIVPRSTASFTSTSSFESSMSRSSAFLESCIPTSPMSGTATSLPEMPSGIGLVRWNPPTKARIAGGRYLITDVPLCIRHTLQRLEQSMRPEAGQGRPQQWITRLAELGVIVQRCPEKNLAQ